MEAEQRQDHNTEKEEEKRKTERTDLKKVKKMAKKEKKKEKKEKKRKQTATVKDTESDTTSIMTASEDVREDKKSKTNKAEKRKRNNVDNNNDNDNDDSEHPNDEVSHEQPYGDDDHEGGDDGGDERKIFLSRIPTKFDADSITRIFETSFGEGCIQHIALPLVRNDDEDDEKDGGGGGEGGVRGRDGKSMARDGKRVAESKDGGRKREEEEEGGEHRGFAFVTMTSIDGRNEAVEKGTIRGTVKETSKRKHTMYIRSIVRNDNEDGEGTTAEDAGASAALNVCYLWSKCRCPYGDACKFKHVGEGGCIIIDKDADGTRRKKKQKCFAFQSKGGCKLGDGCPYSHEIDERDKGDAACIVIKDKKDKDCINWKSKGKCRKKDTCPYRHDEAVRDAFLAKKCERPSKKRKANPQPLSVRVFGLNYDTKILDVQEHFGHCGVIKEVTFPVYEDSGRSKGYCGILFTSPKATDKACELDGKELFGRWLSVQPGKMYLKQWAEREQLRLDSRKNGKSGDDTENTSPVQNVGEFGQKVKTRKKHGFKV